MQRHQRRRALLDHLLMAALDGALAFAEVDHVAVAVADQLDLDVARALDQLLDVDFGAAEGALGLAGGIAQGGLEIASRGSTRRMPLPPPPADGLEQDGVAVVAGERAGLVEVRPRWSVPGTTGAPAAMAVRARGRLRAHARGWRPAEGPMKTMPGVLAGGGEIGVLAQEAVAGVDGFGAVAARRHRGCGRCAGSFRCEGDGPMRSASSAMRTCSEVRSASE